MPRHVTVFCALVSLITGCPNDDDGGGEGETSGPMTTSMSASSTTTSSTTDMSTSSSESGEPSTSAPETSSSTTGEPETSSSSTGGGGLVWLQNDSFTPQDSITWQIWPGVGDCWASMYEIDNSLYPFDIVAVEVAIGGAGEMHTYEVGVWTVDGNNGPGEPIDTAMVDITGDVGFEPHIDIEGMLDVPTIENGSFAIVMCHTDHLGAPSIGTDQDDTVNGSNNWVYQITADEWVQAPDFFMGIDGDFIMRAGVRPAA